MDEMFITCILDIVDPKRELSPEAVIKLVEDRFTPNGPNSKPACSCCQAMDGERRLKVLGITDECPKCGRKLSKEPCPCCRKLITVDTMESCVYCGCKF